MTSLTEMADEAIELARKLREHRAHIDSIGQGWTQERNTMLGRIETLEQSLASAGVPDLNSTNVLTVAAHAAAIREFGTDAAKAAYLRARGWKFISAQFRMWEHPRLGQWNFETAMQSQLRSDLEPLRGLAMTMVAEPQHILPASDLAAPPIVVTYPTEAVNVPAVQYATDSHVFVRDSKSGEVIGVPVAACDTVN